jgi:MFS family permease
MSDLLLEPPVVAEANVPVPVSSATVRRWLIAFYSYILTNNTVFSSAIWVIYLAAHGYSPFAIGLVETTFHVVKFVAEVPTGVFADLVGRRKSLVVACVMGAVGELCFLTPAAPLVLLSISFSALSFAFRGGAEESLLWMIAGHQAPTQQTTHYSKLVSRMFLIMLVGEVIGSATGGFLGRMLQVLPFLCQAAMYLLAILPLLFVPEQRVAASAHVSALRHVGKAFRVAWRTPVLLGLLLVGALSDSCWTTIYYYNQLYLHGLGFSLAAIGLIIAGSRVINFGVTAAAPRLMRVLPPRWLVPLFVGIGGAGVLVMSLPQAVLSLVGYTALLQIAVAVLYPALSTYLNERCPEEQRATVLSLQTGLFSAAMIVLFPLFGLGATQIAYTVLYRWVVAALIGGCAAVAGLVWFLKCGKGQER